MPRLSSPGLPFPVLKAGDRIVVDIRFRNILKGGEGYTIHYTVNNTQQVETQEILDLIELAMHFESLRDETHPIWYLIYYPFQFQYSKIPAPCFRSYRECRLMIVPSVSAYKSFLIFLPMSEKHILIVTSELVPFHYGGIGTQFKSLSAFLKRHGHHVSLLARKPDNYDEALYRYHYGEVPLFFIEISRIQSGLSQHFCLCAGSCQTF